MNSDIGLVEVTRKAIVAHQGLRNLELTIDRFIENGLQTDAMEMLPILQACTEAYHKTWDSLLDRPL